VRISTRDAEALAAVDAFLRFQIEDHRTGDSGQVQSEQRSTFMPAPGSMSGHLGISRVAS
jgi:hypothetical protein